MDTSSSASRSSSTAQYSPLRLFPTYSAAICVSFSTRISTVRLQYPIWKRSSLHTSSSAGLRRLSSTLSIVPFPDTTVSHLLSTTQRNSTRLRRRARQEARRRRRVRRPCARSSSRRGAICDCAKPRENEKQRNARGVTSSGVLFPTLGYTLESGAAPPRGSVSGTVLKTRTLSFT